jgi:RimJ/RimL family protein N-acetyltransferase
VAKQRRGVKTALGRLEIRRWAEEDAANLARMYNRNRDEIIATEPWRTAAHFTEEGQRSRHRKAALQEPPFVGWVVLEDGVVAGTIGLDNVTDGCATLGYWIDAARRRRGLAASAVELVLDQAFTVMALQQLVANTLPDNRPSLAVLRHLGFELAGSVVLKPGGEHLRFEWRPVVWCKSTAGPAPASG